jgi:hypothetical protein
MNVEAEIVDAENIFRSPGSRGEVIADAET